jgi:hypothetical protein
MRIEKEEALNNIVECFTGEDGGVKFALFLNAIRNLDQQAIKGDKSAEELLMLMVHFSKFINVVTKIK